MDMFVQIASSLQYIHSKRILHRDLKTQNIFLSKGNIIKLGDFGISKVLEKTDQFATTVTGTPYYMAPEICTNQPYTFKSDIWSLGCVLYELCTLKHAFAADSLLSLVYQIVRGNFPPIPPNQFSQGLSNLVNALLVRDANQRPSLMQVIAMPYVHQSVQRYRQESQRNLEKQSSTMARRQQLLDKTGEAAAAQ
ncbi:protein kinase domain-containing protein, partial [Haematococcus lacustris]